MPSTSASEAPSVALSFANNFWGKDDAGVTPMLERMHNAKTTGDELKSFYTARIAIEDDYARKLLNLARKPLGSGEMGTLRMSLDVVRGEVESTGKAHQAIATQMKRELDEPLTAFTGGMKERRKIVQSGIERLHKVKQQQYATVNKSRDRYEQDCLKVKGYLAQGHMVMGQEERKNKAKLEKTQIQLSSNNHEYESAVRALEDTTVRWNREWKLACDKFQDLEEERIDFMKSSLWTFANVASTVCVSDDASCEKIRLSLEDCDVEKDITNFIRDYGTGQEIPDPPKYINFCRADVNDAVTEASDDGNYSVAQFQRTMNPTYRSSSPNPSTLDSQHEQRLDNYRNDEISNQQLTTRNVDSSISAHDFALEESTNNSMPPQYPNDEEFQEVPHNEYPIDGMTQFCRIGPPSGSSSTLSQNRPSSRDSQSDVSNPTSFTSAEPSLGAPSPTKQLTGSELSVSSTKEIQKKRSGFFQNRSPFRRKSQKEKENSYNINVKAPASKRNTWASSAGDGRQPPAYNQETAMVIAPGERCSASPEPVDPRANFQLNVGNNVFDVASPDAKRRSGLQSRVTDESDPIAQALAELKGITKESSVRVSADRYHGISSAASPSRASDTPNRGMSTAFTDRTRTTPSRNDAPPSYEQPAMSRLGAPQPAFTSRQMQQTTQKYQDQKQNMFSSPSKYNTNDQQQQQRATNTSASRPGSQAHSRATSPVPFRSTSPRPEPYADQQPRQSPSRAASPNPQINPYRPTSQLSNTAHGRPRAQTNTPSRPRGEGFNTGYASADTSPAYNSMSVPRTVSPQPQFSRSRYGGVPPGGNIQDANMAMQLAQPNPQGYQQSPTQQQRGSTWRQNGNTGAVGRPLSQYGAGNMMANASPSQDQRARSKSTAGGGGQLSQDGRPILHFSRAQYMYQAAIPEELSFAKGDILAVLRLQDDGWWEAEVTGKRGRPGLVPSNYLVNC